MRWLFASYREISASGITIPFDKGWVWLLYQLPIGVLSSLCLPKSHQSFSSVTKCPPLKLVIARAIFYLELTVSGYCQTTSHLLVKKPFNQFRCFVVFCLKLKLFSVCAATSSSFAFSFNAGMGASRGAATMAVLALPRRWWRHVRRRDCQS